MAKKVPSTRTSTFLIYCAVAMLLDEIRGVRSDLAELKASLSGSKVVTQEGVENAKGPSS